MAQRAPGGSTGGSSATPAAASVTVHVLNGSGVPGLARKISQKLTGSGYAKANVTFGTAPGAQNATTTTVAYAVGEQAAAQAVAAKIGTDPAAVTPLDSAAAAASPGSQVVVTVGSDLKQ